MKKIFGFILLLSIAATFNACKKASVTGTKNDTPKPALNEVSRASTFGTTQVWLVGLGQCLPSPYNCGSDVVVTSKRSLADALQIAINGGTNSIAQFFLNRNNWEVFPASTTVTDAQLNDLASGMYNIIEITDPENPYKRYYLCGPAETLTEDNPEYVISVTFTP